MSNILSDALDKVMRQAVVVDSADGVDTILNIDSALLKKRLSENGSTVSPLALAILNDAPRAAEVLLKNGAHPNDWARDGKTALQVAVRRAGTGSMAAQTILVSMLEFVSDLIPVALRNTVKTGNPQLVSSILSLMSDSSTVQNTPPDPLYDFVLALKNKRKDQMNRQNQLEIIDMLHAWDSTLALPHAHTQAVQYAIKFDNYAALEKLLSLGVVNMESLPEVLQWCIRTDQELKWQNLLKLYGTLELL
ncbi:hypothetical protein CC86DRAFT_365594 [Ophiobolus disseminans]|uniref:Uncharacterized protein n=1 Tax=Ophiobolus disseminans TaxID=1469910 RepID=A0A6A7AKU3_9PLEO|nr:hypothetical protein CC86DRAFT_365594 [Ophiobolus disseminans]